MKGRKHLPSGWAKELVGNLFDVQLGKMLNEKAKEGEQHPYLANFNVRWGKFDLERLNSMAFSEREQKKYTLHYGDLLVCEGGEIGRCAVWKINRSGIYYQKALHRIRSKNEISSTEYFYFYMQYLASKRLLLKLVGETSIAHLTREKLLGLTIPLPPLPEQKAIADLLATWDEAIEKTKRLIQEKESGLKVQIQRIMGREAIDANGWSMVHLGELFSEVTRKVGEKELTPYSISAGIGFVSQREKWGKDISGSQHKNYTHLKAGEFSYNKGNSKRYQQGCIYLLKNGEICVPNVFISFKPRAKNVVPEFFEHYFIADYHARELQRYITSGARSDGLLNLNKKDFFKILVPFPSPDEQKPIAEALTASQQEITLLKQLAEQYKTQKRGLMQKMLAGEWRVKPEIVNQVNQYMEA